MIFSLFFLALLTASIRGVLSHPLNETVWNSLDNQAQDILSRATPAAPHFVVYDDAYDGKVGPPAVSKIKVKYSHRHRYFLLLN